MSRIWAAIDAGEARISGVLAVEALKNAAARRGRAIEVELRTAAGVLFAFGDEKPDTHDALLVVGDDPSAQAYFPDITHCRVSLQQVLADPDGVLDKLRGKAPQGNPRSAAPASAQASATKRIVAVTSCPTGIAHTFMAAEGLIQAAAELGHVLRVETQGSVGAGTPLTAEEIAAADVVIIAADREVDRSRFAGKRVLVSSTKPAITAGRSLIERAFSSAELQSAERVLGATPAVKQEGAGPYKHLMNGVSFMLPFVVAGGLLIALAFAFGGIYANADERTGTLAHTLFQIGAKGGFALMVPALSGYIAFSIADRPGLAPGMIGGLLAADLGAGFLGGIAGGFIAGYSTRFFNTHISLPKNLQGLKPVLILPLLGTLLTGLLMVYAIGTPVAAVMSFLTEWLKGMQGTSAIALGMLLGAMSAFDMGGPVNKAGYAFSTALIASHIYAPMAATMAAGMTPPLAVALATRLFATRFSSEEREAGSAAGVLGLSFITEGAIPFAARDPLRVIPALMLGSAVAGAISMAAGVELRVPHGGIFVLPIPGAVTHLLSYLGALLAGTSVSAVLLGMLKRPLTTQA